MSCVLFVNVYQYLCMLFPLLVLTFEGGKWDLIEFDLVSDHCHNTIEPHKVCFAKKIDRQ